MAGVTATTGLFSGIDSGSLITQLMALEARPKTLIQIRVQQLQFQQGAYLDLNSRLSALKTASALRLTIDGGSLRYFDARNGQSYSLPALRADVSIDPEGVIAAKGFLDGEGAAIGAIPWRALGLILGAVLFFGLTVRGLGLVPSTFGATLMSAFASRRTGVVAALLIAVGLTVLCVLVFVVALSLRLPLIGPWIQV